MLGIASNATVKDVELNLSGNALGSVGSQVLEDCLPTAAHIATLDLSDNGNSHYISMIISYSYILWLSLFLLHCRQLECNCCSTVAGLEVTSELKISYA